MSTIVAVSKAGRNAIAWDSVTTFGSTRCVNATTPGKVQRVGDTFIGSAGLSVYCNILDDYLKTRRPPPLKDDRSVFQYFLQFRKALGRRYHIVNEESDKEDPTPFADLDAEFLVVNPRGLFLVGDILSVRRYERFCAIGSGAPHAEGALHVLYDLPGSAAKIAERAVAAAIEFDRSSGGPIIVEEVRSQRAK